MDTLIYILLGALVVLAVIHDIRNPSPTPPDAESLTSADEKCQALRLRQAKARQWMRRNGIKSLLDGRKGWTTLNPMAAAEPPAKVVQLKRKPR